MAAEAERQGISVDDLEWGVPYLPIDPRDVGRSYEAVIRVNSQSGKGGVSYLLKTDHHLDLPRRLQIEFSQVVQRKTDTEGGEVSSEQIWSIFQDEYLPVEDHDAKWGRFEIFSTATQSELGGAVALQVRMRDGEEERDFSGEGNGPIAAFLDILSRDGVDIRLFDYVEHTMGASGDAKAAAYVELDVNGRTLWGVGIDPDISTASLKAIVSAVNRALRLEQKTPELVGATR